jgi:hypothetical protein
MLSYAAFGCKKQKNQCLANNLSQLLVFFDQNNDALAPSLKRSLF